jgi:hypothetical protein
MLQFESLSPWGDEFTTTDSYWGSRVFGAALYALPSFGINALPKGAMTLPRLCAGVGLTHRANGVLQIPNIMLPEYTHHDTSEEIISNVALNLPGLADLHIIQPLS